MQWNWVLEILFQISIRSCIGSTDGGKKNQIVQCFDIMISLLKHHWLCITIQFNDLHCNFIQEKKRKTKNKTIRKKWVGIRKKTIVCIVYLTDSHQHCFVFVMEHNFEQIITIMQIGYPLFSHFHLSISYYYVFTSEIVFLSLSLSRCLAHSISRFISNPIPIHCNPALDIIAIVVIRYKVGSCYSTWIPNSLTEFPNWMILSIVMVIVVAAVAAVCRWIDDNIFVFECVSQISNCFHCLSISKFEQKKNC